MKFLPSTYRKISIDRIRSSSSIDPCVNLRFAFSFGSFKNSHMSELHEERRKKNVHQKEVWYFHTCMRLKTRFDSLWSALFSLNCEKNRRKIQQLAISFEQKWNGKRKHTFGVGFVVSLLKNRAQKKYHSKQQQRITCRRFKLVSQPLHATTSNVFQTFFLLFLARSLRACCI